MILDHQRIESISEEFLGQKFLKEQFLDVDLQKEFNLFSGSDPDAVYTKTKLFSGALLSIIHSVDRGEDVGNKIDEINEAYRQTYSVQFDKETILTSIEGEDKHAWMDTLIGELVKGINAGDIPGGS